MSTRVEVNTKAQPGKLLISVAGAWPIRIDADYITLPAIRAHYNADSVIVDGECNAYAHCVPAQQHDIDQLQWAIRRATRRAAR